MRRFLVSKIIIIIESRTILFAKMAPKLGPNWPIPHFRVHTWSLEFGCLTDAGMEEEKKYHISLLSNGWNRGVRVLLQATFSLFVVCL